MRARVSEEPPRGDGRGFEKTLHGRYNQARAGWRAEAGKFLEGRTGKAALPSRAFRRNHSISIIMAVRTREARRPLHKDVADIISEKIIAREWAPGSFLPTEAE